MPFINLSKKKKEEQPAQQAPADNNLGTPAQNMDTTLSGAAPVMPPTNSPEGTDLHEESKAVPTTIPGQPINVDMEGIKEMKGPPLPGDAPTTTQTSSSLLDSLMSDTPSSSAPASEEASSMAPVPSIPGLEVPAAVSDSNSLTPDSLSSATDTLPDLGTPKSESTSSSMDLASVVTPPAAETSTMDVPATTETQTPEALTSAESPVSSPSEMPTAAAGPADGISSLTGLPSIATSSETSSESTATIPAAATTDASTENALPDLPASKDLAAQTESTTQAESTSSTAETKVEDTKMPDISVPATNDETIINAINPKSSTIDSYFDLVLDKNASDLHFTVGYPPFLRIDGTLQPIGADVVTQEDSERLLLSVLNEDQKKTLESVKEIDFSHEYKEDARFRINIYYERGHLAGAFRYIPTQIRTVEELKLPKILHDFLDIPHGFILVTGPTGSGKSTTIASMIHEVNMKQRKHIITVEDPIEYVYPKAMALVDQREVQEDTQSWENALRATLRQDPNVVVVGEMRDYETIAAAITVAETGHLVFSTLHTNTAVQTIDRIIDVFPEHQQAQIRSQLANVITAVVSQRLIPVRSGGRRAVTEILIGTNAVRNAIRESKTYQIDNIIQTSLDVGMITLEKSLVALIREGELSVEDAQKYTTKPDELLRLIKKV